MVNQAVELIVDELDNPWVFSAYERALINGLAGKLDYYRDKNLKKVQLYEGDSDFKNLNIALPPSLNGMKASVAYSAIIVDRINERINLTRFESSDENLQEELNYISDDNEVILTAPQVHQEAMVYGTSYVMVDRGDVSKGEPKVLITRESPMTMTGVMNPRTKRVDQAIKIKYRKDKDTLTGYKNYRDIGVLLLPEYSLYFRFDDDGNPSQVLYRDEHKRGSTGVFRFINKPTPTKPDGSSEISKTISYFTDSAVRTLVELEIAREMTAIPSKYFMGVSLDGLRGPDGKPLKKLNNFGTTALHFGPQKSKSESGSEAFAPQIGQFPVGDLTPFIKTLDTYATQISSETGIPPHYFGRENTQPMSAEAHQSVESIMVGRVKNRILSFNATWAKIMKYALMLDGSYEADSRSKVTPVFDNPSYFNLGVAADAIGKLITAGVTPPDSDYVVRMLAITKDEVDDIAERFLDGESSVLRENIALIAENARRASETIKFES